MVQFSSAPLVLDLDDAVVDVVAHFLADDTAYSFEMFHELFSALVGIFFGVGHGVVGERVDDGYFGELG